MNRYYIGGTLFLVLVLGLVLGLALKSRTTAPVAPASITVPRPISDVDCGNTYQFDQIKRFLVNGQVVVNFHFGGKDRERQPQYIADKDVLGLSTEESRTVNRSLTYSEVRILCLSDKSLEGHRASNVEVLRYRLNLRRPLVPQRFIPNGGPAR